MLKNSNFCFKFAFCQVKIMKIQTEGKKGFSENSDLPIFFIVGMGRSGSTLLQLLLDAHPHVRVSFESLFIIFLFKKYAHKKKWNKNLLEAFYKDLFWEEKIHSLWEIDRKKLRDQILSQPENTDFGKLCRLVHLNFISLYEKKEIRIIGDKNPINTLQIPELLQVFPEAKFIHLARDPRAVCLSQIKAGFYPNVVSAALMWRDYEQLIAKTKSKFPEQFFSLKYEDLVNGPTDCLKSVFHFLGVGFQASVLEYHKKISAFKELVDEKEPDHKKEMQLKIFSKFHKNLATPINTNSLDKWKEEMPENQIRLVEGITAEKMKNYTYEPLYKPQEWKTPTLFQKITHVSRKQIIKTYYKTPMFWRKAARKIRVKLMFKLLF